MNRHLTRAVPPLIARASAVTSALALAPYARVDWPWLALGWIGLVSWLAALDGTKTPRGVLAGGWLLSGRVRSAGRRP